jgi:hypothetical protein
VHSRLSIVAGALASVALGCATEDLSPLAEVDTDLCENVVCGDAASCAEGVCTCDEWHFGDPNVFCEAVTSHVGWVGSECADDLDCTFSESLCLQDEEGFPAGYCTVACDRYCDDQADAPMTFCVGEPDFAEGQCVSRCDIDIYPWTDGCRPGYYCVERERNGTGVSEFVCLPP